MIGVFDSGVGGLTVVKEIFNLLPEQQIIYFGDTAHLPYGTKGESFVKKSSEKITKWLLDKGVDVIVVACNTSSAWASDFLKEKFPKVPIFEMITPAVEDITALGKKKIGIIGTPGTIESQAYNKKLLTLNPSLKIFPVSCPLFVPLVEEGWLEGKVTERIAERYLKSLKNKKIESLILACTHYPLLEGTIRKVMGEKVNIINPAKSLANQLNLFLENNPKFSSKIKKGENHKFYFSEKPYNYEKISRLCFKEKIKHTLIKPLL